MYWQVEAANHDTMIIEADSRESAIYQYCAATSSQPEDVIYCVPVNDAY